MRRTFTKLQRRILAYRSGGFCSICGKKLTNDFHADHVQPYSQGGRTITKNGQTLCAKCNLRKGANDKT